MGNDNVVVIGAGPGGLAAAMLLAKQGKKVTVLERRGVVGGRTSAIEADGFRFDMGPTFFLYPAVLESIFEQCGENLHDHVTLKRLDPQYDLTFEAGGKIRATPDIARMGEQISNVSPKDAPAFDRFMSDNRKKFEAFRPILESPFNSWTDLLKINPFKAMPLIRPWRSVDRDLRSHFDDERIRLAFSFQSKYLGMSPFQCPSLFTILSFMEYEYGVFHPIGGCAAISEAMAKVAAKLGADIRLNEEVTGIDFKGRKAVGVRTQNNIYRSDAMVINADFAHAMEKMVPDHLRRRWTNKKIAKKKFSCSTFMMYLGIDGQYDDLGHHTIFLAKNYEKNLREIENEHVLSKDPSFYVQNPCVTDPTLAPEGKSALYVLAPVTHQHENVDWQKETVGFRRRILEQMKKIGLDDVEDRIEYEKVLTPAGWQQDMAIHKGATFNLAHTFRQMLHLRPHNRFEDLQSVYLVGGGTHPGSGLPVIFQSALITSQLVEQDLRRNVSSRLRKETAQSRETHTAVGKPAPQPAMVEAA